MEKTCKHCEDAKRTYVWVILAARHEKGVPSLACSHCDMVAAMPKEKNRQES